MLHADWEKFIKNIERGEQRIARKDEMMQAIERKLARYRNPWYELKIQYGQNKGKLYTEEDDRFLVRPETLLLNAQAFYAYKKVRSSL